MPVGVNLPDPVPSGVVGVMPGVPQGVALGKHPVEGIVGAGEGAGGDGGIGRKLHLHQVPVGVVGVTVGHVGLGVGGRGGVV